MKIPELNCTITLENASIEDFIESNDIMVNTVCQVKIIGTLVPRICEHCKFWDGISRHTLYGQCNNPKVCVVCSGEGKVYYPDTYGCIFWESK
jgi:hypothetical protein